MERMSLFEDNKEKKMMNLTSGPEEHEITDNVKFLMERAVELSKLYWV